MKQFFLKNALPAIIAIVMLTMSTKSEASTRVVYKGTNGTIVTARSMDFSMEIPANLWQFPRGKKREGHTRANTVKCTYKYGSIVVSTWETAVTDGMNEK